MQTLLDVTGLDLPCGTQVTVTGPTGDIIPVGILVNIIKSDLAALQHSKEGAVVGCLIAVKSGFSRTLDLLQSVRHLEPALLHIVECKAAVHIPVMISIELDTVMDGPVLNTTGEVLLFLDIMLYLMGDDRLHLTPVSMVESPGKLRQPLIDLNIWIGLTGKDILVLAEGATGVDVCQTDRHLTEFRIGHEEHRSIHIVTDAQARLVPVDGLHVKVLDIIPLTQGIELLTLIGQHGIAKLHRLGDILPVEVQVTLDLRMVLKPFDIGIWVELPETGDLHAPLAVGTFLPAGIQLDELGILAKTFKDLGLLQESHVHTTVKGHIKVGGSLLANEVITDILLRREIGAKVMRSTLDL